MNIMLINHHAGSKEHGMEFRPYYLAREWIKLGHKVWIYASEFTHLRVINPRVTVDFQEENIEGITYVWLKTGKYEANGIKRAASIIKFVLKLAFHARALAKKVKPDAVIASSTYPLDTYPAQLIARTCKATLIHEVHDLWPLSLIEVGGMSKYHPFVMLMQMAENSAYSRSDKVVSLLPGAKEYMIRHGLKQDRFASIPNGIVSNEWELSTIPPKAHLKLLKSLSDNGRFICCFFGSHIDTYGILSLLKAALILKDNKEFAFVFIGEGRNKKDYEIYVQTNSLGNSVFFLPTVKKTELITLLLSVDCIYVGAEKLPLFRYGISMNKIYDAMMASKPIIYAIEAFNNPILEAKCGITIEPDNPEAIIAALTRIKAMSPVERASMGNRGRTAAKEKYDYSFLAEQFTSLIETVAQKH